MNLGIVDSYSLYTGDLPMLLCYPSIIIYLFILNLNNEHNHNIIIKVSEQ